MADQTQTRMTAAEFLELPESNLPIELIDGEVIMSPTPIPAHQRLVGRFYKLIDGLAPNGEVFIAPLDVYLDEANVVQPDVMWVAEDSACRIEEKYLLGAPDLVVEVLSPGTARRDRREKFRLYEQYGAREYWMVDPQAEFVEVWRLEGERFRRQGIYAPGESFTNALLGDQPVDLTPLFAQ